MKFLIKGVVVIGLLISFGCSSTPQDTVDNNKKIAQVVLALKSNDFDKAYGILGSLEFKRRARLSTYEWAEVFYSVYGSDGYNPQRSFKEVVLIDYVKTLERASGEILKCIKVSKETSFEYKQAKACLIDVRERSLKELRNESYISGKHRANFEKTRCYKEPKFCSVFGRITEKPILEGAGAFIYYWINPKILFVDGRYKELIIKEEREAMVKVAIDKKRQRSWYRIQSKLDRNKCEIFYGSVTQKFNNYRYEVYYSGGYQKGLSGRCSMQTGLCKYSGILKTVSTVFPSTGVIPAGMSVRKERREKVKTIDGFDQVWEVFKESKLCKKLHDEYRAVK